MIVICGKTASGKTTVVKKLCEEFGYKQLITYTTRPMRDGEENDVTYHFISEEYFKYKIEQGFFAEWKSYKTNEGVWYYGVAKEDIENADDNTIVILTPSGLKDIRLLGYRPKVVYLYANNTTIRKRLTERGDKKEEIDRRLIADNADFSDMPTLAHKIVYNEYDKRLDSVVEVIDVINKENKW